MPTAAAAQRAAGRHRLRARSADRAARRPRRPPGRRPHRRPLGQHRPGRRARLRPRRARRGTARRRPGARRGRRPAAGPGAADLPAGRGDHARRRADGDRGRRARRGLPDLRPARRPRPSTSAPSACARARSPAPPTPSTCCSTGKGGHTSRPHLTEDLTFALGKLVTELPAVLSRRLDPRAGRERGVGDRPVRLGGQRHPRDRSRRRHRPDARRRRLGRRGGAGPRHDRADRGAVRRHADDHLRPRRAAGRQRAPVDRAARQGGRDACSARRPTWPPARASAARTSRGTSRAFPARWAGSARARRAARRTTSTRATCGWTNGPISVGAKVLAAAALKSMVTDR